MATKLANTPAVIRAGTSTSDSIDLTGLHAAGIYIDRDPDEPCTLSFAGRPYEAQDRIPTRWADLDAYIALRQGCFLLAPIIATVSYLQISLINDHNNEPVSLDEDLWLILMGEIRR